VVIGSSGSGKTTLALAFASRATLGEAGLLMTCTEEAEDLERAGVELGLALAEAVHGGVLRIERFGLEDEAMDQIGHRILRLVDEFQIRRLVVDGLAGLADTLAFPERGYRFLGRLLAELRRRGVTSLFTVDPAALSVAAGTSLAEGVVGWFDNAFGFVQERPDGAPSLQRLLAIHKVRAAQASAPVVNVHLASSLSRTSSARTG
jgi:circadian clock protein KaiC